MTKTVQKPDGIVVEDNTNVAAPATAKVESVVTKLGDTEIETFVGLQTGINFAEPAAPAAEGTSE